MPRQILTAPSAVEEAEKEARAELDKIKLQLEASYEDVADRVLVIVEVFIRSVGELRAKHAAIRQGLLDRLSEDAQKRLEGYRWFRPYQVTGERFSLSMRGLTLHWYPTATGDEGNERKVPGYNDMPRRTLPLNENGEEFDYLKGVDAQGHNIPDCLEIDSDEVSPKALAELAMAAVRITKRHREASEDMACFEETARRVLKRARTDGTIVEAVRDHDAEYNEKLRIYNNETADNIHKNRLASGYYDRAGPNGEMIWQWSPAERQQLWKTYRPDLFGPPDPTLPPAPIEPNDPVTVARKNLSRAEADLQYAEAKAIEAAEKEAAIAKEVAAAEEAKAAKEAAARTAAPKRAGRRDLPSAKPAPKRRTGKVPPKGSSLTQPASVPKSRSPTPVLSRAAKIKITKEKIAAAALAATATADSDDEAAARMPSPATIPSTSQASPSPAPSRRSRLASASPPRSPVAARTSRAPAAAPSPTAAPISPAPAAPSSPPPRSPIAAPTSPAPAAPISPGFNIPDSPPRRRAPRRGCRKSNMKLPSSDSEDSEDSE